MQTSSLCETACRFTNAKTYVFSDSVLCGWKVGYDPTANWKSKINGFRKQSFRRDESNRWNADGVRVETVPKNHSVEHRSTSNAESSSCQCFCDIVWDAKGNKEQCVHNSQAVAEYARQFPRGHWSFLGLGSEEKWYETNSQKPDGSWDRMAEEMMANDSRSGHPIFRASRALARGKLRSKVGRKKSIHFNDSNENIELLLRTVISASQLSIYGAIADLCDELSEVFWVPVKPAAPKHLEKVEIPTVRSEAENSTNDQQWRNLRQEYERKFEQLSEDQKLSKLCSDAGLKLVEPEQYFCTLETEERQQMQHLCWVYMLPRNEEGTRVRGWVRSKTRIGPVLNINFCCRDEKYSNEDQVPSLFQDNTASWVRTVNGVDKYVTKSMPNAKEESIASGKPIAKARLQFLLLFLTGNGSTLQHNGHTITSVVKCQKQSLDCCDMIKQSFEETTERSTTVTSLKSAGGRSSTTLRSGFLKIGYQKWQRKEERRKDANIVRIQTLPINSYIFEQFKYIYEKVRLILHCKTKYWFRKDLPSISDTSGARTNWIQKNNKWISSMRNEPQKRKTSSAVLYTTVNQITKDHAI